MTLILLLLIVFTPLIAGGIALFIRIRRNQTHVKCIIAYPDKSVAIKYVKPVGYELRVNGNAWHMKPELVNMHKTSRTFFLNTQSNEPIPIHDLNSASFYNSGDWDTIVQSKLAKELFDASGNKLDVSMVTIIGICVIVAVLAIVGYLGYQEITILRSQLNEIREILRMIGGV